ncbi:MAG: 2-C-methyl-D-erythritol 4-phosphate cytidylyltransferase [Sedimentisphaerales bacterium]|nr:2-C-methyl-D-erythritol 4-phosphate cytidylyltransferase [Sedimentisphaerales bacterium]
MTLRVSVLIPAAGSSSRFGAKRKKQFTDLDGRAIFLRSIEIFADRDDVAQVIVAIPAEDEELFQVKWSANLSFFGVKHIIGGEQRHDSINKMLAEVHDDEVDLIAVHDAVRPCVSKEQIDAVFAAAAETGAAILAHQIVGTIKQADKNNIITGTLDRTELWEAQTPQVFRPDIIREAYQRRNEFDESITDDSQLVEALGVPVRLVESNAGNVKITSGVDLAIASAVLKSRPSEKPKGPAGPWAGEQGW